MKCAWLVWSCTLFKRLLFQFLYVLLFVLLDNCDLHLKVAPDGLSGKPLEDEGFSYLFAGARATWGATKGKVCFECKVCLFNKHRNDK